ncbi:ankyrin repeat domain-containing protein 61 isoform X3 [Cynoglossus semilaevis]|uniref:ankyrin repeat domain-containing protein 61 isoform X3 n=1 Tax=Cynoglossus semilaevis TaxID=244447 RepID=UPI0004985990|nr:ankyrin repeat domain-containing protein 61 isoform X3 [Cynoglossus semilaevis]
MVMEAPTQNGNFYHNKFYSAIMDQDDGRITDLAERHGVNVYIKGGSILPLHLAVCYRKVKSMKSLLSAGADPEESWFFFHHRDRLGRTTLHLAITDWPSRLTIWQKPDFKLQPALMGVYGNAQACLRLLCEQGVDINTKVEGQSQETALHLSVRYAAPAAVKILTSFGANVNAVDHSGMTPLHMAAGTLHKDIITWLIRHGADVNKEMKQSGNSALHLACTAFATKSRMSMKNDMSCISELLEHGAEPDAVNKAGLTPIHEACMRGNEELVDLLLRYGAEANKLSCTGENCLFLFLDHRPNIHNNSLLAKLLNLTSPLNIYNHSNRLPSTLTLPHFFKQREQLVKLSQAPRKLQEICKRCVYLTYVRHLKEELKKSLPGRVYNLIFKCWETHNIIFMTGD